MLVTALIILILLMAKMVNLFFIDLISRIPSGAVEAGILWYGFLIIMVILIILMILVAVEVITL